MSWFINTDGISWPSIALHTEELEEAQMGGSRQAPFHLFPHKMCGVKASCYDAEVEKCHYPAQPPRHGGGQRWLKLFCNGQN